MQARADTESRVEQGLDTLRSGFAADGAGLELTEWTSEHGVRITLTLQPDACEDCIVATDLLHTMVDGAIRQAAPEISQVQLVDPRTDSTS